jgi:hypothetical protein
VDTLIKYAKTPEETHNALDKAKLELESAKADSTLQ